MKDLMQYFIQSGFSMTVLYGLYWILLRKETCFACNRYFLIFAMLFSALIPFAPDIFQINTENVQYYAMLKPLIVGPEIETGTITNFDITTLLFWAYLSGVIINVTIIAVQTIRTVILAQKSRINRRYGLNVVFTDKNISNFSFFNIIFISNSAGNKENIEKIITHEKAHIIQKHFIDLILIELITAIFWFNPVIWLYKRSLIAVHEYLADEYVLSKGIEKSSYQNLLMTQSFGFPIYALTNNFNQSLIKRRFIMMSKTKSKFKGLFKLLLVMPAVFAIAFIISCNNETNEVKPTPPPNVSKIQDSEDPDQVIFNVVEKMPEFPGGDAARIKYLNKNLKYPEKAKNNRIEGKVFITFVVEKDGSITNAKVLRGIGGGCDEESVRVIENMPKWIPGMQKGKPVRVRFNMPIVFRLGGAKDAA